MSLRKCDKMIAVVVTVQSIHEMFFPIGSIVMGDNLTDEEKVKSIYGGASWQRITGALYGIGDQVTTLGTVNEEAPNISGTIGAHSSFSNLCAPNGVFSASAMVSQYGTVNNAGTSANSINILAFNASGSSSVFKNGGHILAKGTATYAWKRTA